MKLPLPLFAILSGLLLVLSWPPIPLGFLMLIAFVPLLFFMDACSQQKAHAGKFILWTFLALLIWQVGSLIWFFGMSFKNATLVCLINGGAMAGLMGVAYRYYRSGKKLLAYIAWVALWVGYEYLHLHWDLSFPLLGIGNGLSMYPTLIQWYEFTGVLGGTIWIIAVNCLLFELFRYRLEEGTFLPKHLKTVPLVIGLPIIASVLLYSTYEEKGKEVEVLTIHPNIDCYSEKYEMGQQELLDIYLRLTLEQITPQTEYILWPETALTNAEWVESLQNFAVVQQIREKLKAYPKAKIITGAIIYELYQTGKPEEMPVYISYSEPLNQSYYTYNAAFQIGQEQSVPLRSKKHLVAFEEGIPYPNVLSFLRNVSGSFGGYVFSTRERNQDVFNAPSGHKVSPLICYETAFGATAAQYVKQGAQALFVILNEGWYQHWQGATQLAYISTIRAIETRRSVARSSNYGVSCTINQRGDMLARLDELEAGALLSTIQLNRNLTFYAQTGDYLGVIAAFLAILLFAWSFVGLRLWQDPMDQKGGDKAVKRRRPKAKMPKVKMGAAKRKSSKKG